MREHPERWVALLNGLVVLVLPFLFVAVGPYVFGGDSNTSVTVRGGSIFPDRIIGVGRTVLMLLPFAALAGWRTLIHAKRWRAGLGTGWSGVAEAGATGLAVALVMLAPGIVTRPVEAPPYVIVYGGAALVIGLICGLISRTTAVLFLTLQRHIG